MHRLFSYFLFVFSYFVVVVVVNVDVGLMESLDFLAAVGLVFVVVSQGLTKKKLNK